MPVTTQTGHFVDEFLEGERVESVFVFVRDRILHEREEAFFQVGVLLPEGERGQV